MHAMKHFNLQSIGLFVAVAMSALLAPLHAVGQDLGLREQAPALDRTIPPSSGVPLSREDAVARAFQHNYGLRLVRLQAEQAVAGNEWGAAGALPRVTLTATPSTAVSDQRENPTAFLQEKLESSGLNYGGQVAWTLFDGMGMFANKRALDLLEAQAGGAVDLLVEQTAQAVLQAYDAALVQEALLDVLSKSLRFTQARLEWLANRESVGAAGSFDRLQFEQAALADSSAWIQQQVARRTAVRNLNRLMGVEEDQDWRLTSVLEVPGAIPDLAQLESQIIQSETSIRNALLTEALAETSLDQAQARLYPVLSLAASYGDQYNQIAAGALTGESRVKNSSAALSLNFNLFNGGATRRAIDQARIQIDLASTASANQVAEMKWVLRNAVDRFDTQSSIYALAEQAVTNAEALVNIAADRYTFGALTSLDVRDLQLALLRAEINRLQALQAWNAASIEVQRLMGALRPPRSEG
jgi:outer membrane protein TolC